ncbi:hypothetical protein JQ628_08515 [Bradyrhizobium lablabi]|uniref:hypothetical protein n=1 Tax=Bradyrhizobium lablabi TaxID=722472 RepID=UPI001BA916A4|nr:hypothetical protein [Bradyrhizobium lablabi]MBR1121550.1 hypothetical protein [Bradyrhizobium lablabi]
MTRAISIVALTCILVVGAAAAAILGRDSLPSAGLSDRFELAAAAPTPRGPVSNKESKKDKLAVVAMATAAFEPPQQMPVLTEPLRQAYASTAPSDIGAPGIVTAPAPAPQPKPKAAAKPQPPAQKNYTLLSDAQIAGIKERLKLSPDQESYWPGVEKSLRAIARKMHTVRQSDPAAGAPPIDPDWDEVQQLKSAAMPLLFQLREDQKREVRALARIIGLERVASMI